MNIHCNYFNIRKNCKLQMVSLYKKEALQILRFRMKQTYERSIIANSLR